MYRDHRGWLLAWLRRNVACPQRAEDLSQDTFVRLLGRALKEHLGHKLQQVFLDVADIAPLVCPQANIREAGLDEWIDWFRLEVFERHNSSADALATAELALILFSRARGQQIHSPLNLQQRLSQWKRRQQAPSF